MSEYDQQQYRLMLDRLNAFDRGDIRIDTLIGDLRALVQALNDATSSWKNSFMEEWADLEQALATALSRDVKQFHESEIEIIGEATAKLKLLVLEAIDDDADHPRRPI